MTLNITVGARWLMAQSSDFNLTHEVEDKSGNKLVVLDSESAQKQVVLHYLGWSGLVCYTGVGQYRLHDTAAWLEKVLTHEPGQRKPIDIVNTLKTEAPKWLRRVHVEYRRHTFTMVTYEGSKPKIYVVSNFERLGQNPVAVAADEMFVTSMRPKGPRCVITGYSDAVTEDQRETLLNTMAFKPTPESISSAIAQVNQEVAANANGAVSEPCVVAHLYPDGSGGMYVHGKLPVKFLPALIVAGRNMTGLLPQQIHDASGKPQATDIPIFPMTPEDASKPIGGKNRSVVGATWPTNRGEPAANGTTTMGVVLREVN